MNPSSPRRKEPSRGHERGQVLVIVAIAMVAVIAMVGVVIDGGYAWGKQRGTQNASDAMAKAGAGLLADNLVGVSPQNDDAAVWAAMNQVAAVNGVGFPDGYYTDFQGRMLTTTGALATGTADAAQVGAGAIPPGTKGVRAVADQTFDTFMARVIGFNQFTTTTDATARAGWLTATCDADAGCIVLPIIIPVTVLGCDGQNKPAPITDGSGNKVLWTAPSVSPLTVPLCANAPGNVGWLDWTPNAQTPGCSGTGKAEIACIIANPSNPYLKWPGWYYVPETGNPNSKSIEDAINGYQGQVVMLPQFDLTCDTQPSGPGVDDCPLPNVGGHGNQQWYHLAGMSSFHLCTADASTGASPAFRAECSTAGYTKGAYTNGNNKNPCDTGNGATSCLAGKFVLIRTEGELAEQPGVNVGSSQPGIQLIE